MSLTYFPAGTSTVGRHAPAGLTASHPGGLLQAATGAWAARQTLPGGRFLRDLSGNGRPMRAGGVGSAYTDGSALVLPGVSGNYASVPDEAALDVVGDIDLRCDVALDDWTPAAESNILTKWNTSQLSYRMSVSSSGVVGLYHTSNGTAQKASVSTAATSVSDGGRIQIRATLDVDNGASGHDVKFYTRAAGTDLADDTGWTQLGSTVTTAGTTSVFSGAAIATVGENAAGGGPPAGKFYGAVVKNGIGGATVLDIDFSDADAGGFGETFVCTTGQTVTVNGAATTNDPKVLPYDGTRYLYLPGTTGNYATVPDEAALDITGDIDLRCDVALDDWTPASGQEFVGKWTGSFAFRFRVLPTGSLNLSLSADGSTETTATSTAAVPNVNGARRWVRATWQQSDGRVQFFTSDDGETWVQLGSNVTIAIAAIYSGSSYVNVGGQTLPSAGKFYGAVIKDGIDGTTVLDIDFTSASEFPSGGASTSGTASTGQTVTINRASSGRKAVYVEKPTLLLGTDDYLSIVDDADFDVGAAGKMTIVFAFRSFGHAAFARYVSKGATTPRWSFLSLDTAGRPYNDVHDGTDNVSSTSSNPGSPASGSASTVATVIDLANDVSYNYANGAFASSVNYSAIDTITSTDPIVIAKNAASNGNFLDAELFGVAIFVGRVLTAAQIAQVGRELGA